MQLKQRAVTLTGRGEIEGKAVKTVASVLLLMAALALHGQERTIHVLVALCDNVNQGIIKVPKRIGNGQDPANNLYWGCGYGVKSFFRKHPDWTLVGQIRNPAGTIHERLVFKHERSPVFMTADAYDGAAIRQAIGDFMDYAAGLKKFYAAAGTLKVKAGGDADLICYAGHNGLMDFTIDLFPAGADDKPREVVALACFSRDYFAEAVKKAGAYPLLWTTGLMCPEAYSLAAAIDSWIQREPAERTRERAAQAYDRYQKCGIQAARRLFASGF